jgi:isomerase DpgB
MSKILTEDRPIARIEIDGAGPLSSDLSRQLDGALDRAEDLGGAAILFIYVQGHQNAASLRTWPGQTDIQLVTKWERALRRIERFGSPTVVLAERACSAIALELLLVADRRLATRDFSMQCAIHGSNLWPGMALYRLSRQIGESRARKFLLDSSRILPEAALELNVIDEVIDHAVIDHASQSELVMRYAPPEDFAVRRRLMQDSLFTSFDDALGAHLAACDRTLRRPSSNKLVLAANGTSSA